MTALEKKVKASKPVAIPPKKSKLRFFSDAIAELSKAHWPSRQEALRLSILVLVVCIIMGIILGVMDYGFTRMFTDLLRGG